MRPDRVSKYEMKARHALPAALVAAVTLTSVAAAGPDAAKQRVVPTSQASPTAAGSSLPAGTTSSKLAFISHRHSACCGPGPPFELNVMNADGSGKRVLTRDVWQGLAWSPDGQKFAFVGGRDADVYVINADGSGQRRLTRNAGNHFAPAWSPDGRKIAFGRGNGPHSEQIYIMNADGSGQRRLTRLAGQHGSGLVARREDCIFELARSPSDFEIYVMDADGSDCGT